jgi:YbgC/YbaW family acyl-CoA thioester hydrolase
MHLLSLNKIIDVRTSHVQCHPGNFFRVHAVGREPHQPRNTVTDPSTHPAFSTLFQVRSYELDGLGHVNHAVYLNYLEQARFDALAEGGFPLSRMYDEGWAVHVVRIEVDYRRECRLGDRLRVDTWVEQFRNSSMIIRQRLVRLHETPDHVEAPPDPSGSMASTEEADPSPAQGETAVDARIVAVWVGEDGRPMRIPPQVRSALSATSPD